MKMILAVDAIHRPLTGIGRYAYEIWQRLVTDPHVDALKYIAHGHWIDHPMPNASSDAPTTLSSARARLAESRLAVFAYRQMMPLISRARLKRYRDWVYYSPNFILPPHGGLSVATIHDLSIFDHPEFHPKARVDFMRHELPKTLKRADLLLAVSEFTRQRILEKFNYDSDRVVTVPLGVNPPPNQTDNCNYSDSDILPPSIRSLEPKSYVLCVSTIEPRKNIDRLLQAYRQLPNETRQSHPLVIAGDSGWCSKETHHAMRLASAEGWLHYLGFVSDTELSALMQHSMLLVFPALYEGFGLPVLEVMARGIPVVCSRLEPIQEFAGDAPRYFDPYSIEEISDALKYCIEDACWRGQAVDLGRKVAQNRTWGATYASTIEAILGVSGSS